VHDASITNAHVRLFFSSHVMWGRSVQARRAAAELESARRESERVAAERMRAEEDDRRFTHEQRTIDALEELRMSTEDRIYRDNATRYANSSEQMIVRAHARTRVYC
jgi:hypothetical protein